MTKYKLYHLVLIITTILCSLSTATGQAFDRIATQLSGNEYEMNKVDSCGCKQGEWLHYKTLFNSKCSALSAKTSDTCYFKLSEGKYLNNAKIGTWTYYDDGGCYIAVERTETHKRDGSITEIKYCNSTTTEYSPDSMAVVSTVNVYGDTICIECREKKICIALFENEVVAKFDFTLLDVEQYRMVSGVYNRSIKVIKYNHQFNNKPAIKK